MNAIVKELRANPLLWLLVLVPVVLAGEHIWPERHTLLFLLSVLAIVPLAALLSRATESVADKTGEALGGLLNATLGNLTELIIALTALQAGQYLLVKASIAGAIVSNTLFMLGGAFLIGGLRHHEQNFNRISARLQSGLLFLATVALLVPSLLAEDVLTKPVSEKVLIESIKRALDRFRRERSRREWHKAARAQLERLTPREREVFEYVVRGKANKQAARELGITERTIKAHRQRIFEKLQAKTVAELVSLAERLEILDFAEPTTKSDAIEVADNNP